MTQSERRLSAILHADVAGFVRLVEREEDHTFEYLGAARSRIWRPTIESRRRRARSQLRAISSLPSSSRRLPPSRQPSPYKRVMARFNEGLAEEQRLLFRIGVHVGEIIIDEAGHDIFGDGVNLAERIQVLAEPGGIAVSRAVRDLTELQLRDDYAYVDGGEHRAKHVSRPLHIYRVRAHESAATLPRTSLPCVEHSAFVALISVATNSASTSIYDALAKRNQTVLIGRDSGQCDVVLLHGSISRRHARLSVGNDNSVRIEDMDRPTVPLSMASRSLPAACRPWPQDPRWTGRYRCRRSVRLASGLQLGLFVAGAVLGLPADRDVGQLAPARRRARGRAG